jgi:hypothetical protein
MPLTDWWCRFAIVVVSALCADVEPQARRYIKSRHSRHIHEAKTPANPSWTHPGESLISSADA